MSKKICKICDSTRTKKLAILSEPKVASLLEKARQKGIHGVQLIDASDGTQIEDDEVLESVLQNKLLILMILNSNEHWTPEKDDFGGKDKMAPVTSPTISSAVSLGSSTIQFFQPQHNQTKQVRSFDTYGSYMPYQKFDANILSACSGKRSLTSIQINHIVHVIVQDLRTISRQVPTSAFRRVVEKLMDDFPKSFNEENKDHILCKLLNHHMYLNRSDRKRKLDEPTTTDNSKFKNSRTKYFLSGCVNWQPIQSDEIVGDMKIDFERKRDFLRYLNPIQFTAREFQLMDECYGYLRLFLNDLKRQPNIAEIKLEWPLLFAKEFLFQHFEKLTEIKLENYLKEFEMKRNAILKYFQSKSGILYVQYSNKSCLDCLANYFQNDIASNFVLERFKDLTSPFESDTTEKLPATPFLCFNDELNQFYVYADRKLVNTTSSNFKEALAQIISLYFILNLEYNKECSETLEFIQRYFFGIKSEVLRSKTNNIQKISKVTRLIYLINENARKAIASGGGVDANAAISNFANYDNMKSELWNENSSNQHFVNEDSNLEENLSSNEQKDEKNCGIIEPNILNIIYEPENLNESLQENTNLEGNEQIIPTKRQKKIQWLEFESEETKNLSSKKLERLILLENLRFLRIQSEYYEEKLKILRN